ncbi:hypothetical protein LCGC14_2591610, partial [marine sediment metagenome]
GIAICPLKVEAPEFYKDCVEFNGACPDDCPDIAAKIDAILDLKLNLEPIRELLRLHGEGKLMVLDDDQSWPDHGLPMNCGIGLSRLGVQQIHDRMEGLGWDRAIDKCNDTGFKRVHPPGVKCPSKP